MLLVTLNDHGKTSEQILMKHGMLEADTMDYTKTTTYLGRYVYTFPPRENFLKLATNARFNFNHKLETYFFQFFPFDSP